MLEHRLEGVLTELVTPFRKDLSIDHESIQKLVDFQVENGIRGIFVHGISAESLSMTQKEQVEFVASAAQAAGGRVPVIANLMCSNKERALESLKAFVDSGADAICASQPLMLSYDNEALFDYFASIIQCAPCPVYLYNMPQAGYVVSPTVIGRLANEFQKFQGYKDSTQNIIHLQSVVAAVGREDFSILSGSDATTYATFTMGGTGVVSLISLIFPKLIVDLYETYQRGEMKEAFQKQLFILKVRDALKAAPLISGYKAMIKYLGLFEEDLVRSPLTNTGDEALHKLLKKLSDLGVL